MQPIEDFMRSFFEERTAELMRQHASRDPFRQKFFTFDCDIGTHSARLKMFQSEKVVSISSSDGKAEVITNRENVGSSGVVVDLRYLLERRGESWRIYEVGVRCCACSGEPGRMDCPSCHGTGWRDTNMSGNKAA